MQPARNHAGPHRSVSLSRRSSTPKHPYYESKHTQHGARKRQAGKRHRQGRGRQSRRGRPPGERPRRTGRRPRANESRPTPAGPRTLAPLAGGDSRRWDGAGHAGLGFQVWPPPRAGLVAPWWGDAEFAEGSGSSGPRSGRARGAAGPAARPSWRRGGAFPRRPRVPRIRFKNTAAIERADPAGGVRSPCRGAVARARRVRATAHSTRPVAVGGAGHGAPHVRMNLELQQARADPAVDSPAGHIEHAGDFAAREPREKCELDGSAFVSSERGLKSDRQPVERTDEPIFGAHPPEFLARFLALAMCP